jgi:tetratricopeptide (TPR) repeat protein
MPLRIALISTMMFMFSAAAHAADNDISKNITDCNHAIAEGDASKALAYAEQVLKQDKNNHDALLCKGRAHGGIGQFEQALTALQAAERQSATPLEHIVALTLIGNVQNSSHQYDNALASYKQSLAMAQTEKDAAFQRINLNLIGDTLAASNKMQAALDSYVAGSSFTANDNERADSFARIAATNSALGKHDQAIEYQIKSQLMEERGGDLDHYANAGLELGRIYTVAKDYANAEKSINQIIKLSKDQGGAYWEAKSYYYLARVKAERGETDAAGKLLADAQRISNEIGAQALSDQISQATNTLHK